MKKTSFLILLSANVLTLMAQSPYQGTSLEDFAEGDYYLYNVATGTWLGDNHTTTDRYTSRAELSTRGIEFEITRYSTGYQINPKLGNNHSLNASNLYMDTSSDITVWKLTKTVNEAPNCFIISASSYRLGADSNGKIINSAATRNAWQLVSREERMEVATRQATKETPADLSWAVYGATFPVADERKSWWQGPWGNNAYTGDGYYRCNRVWEIWGVREMEIYQELNDLPNGCYTVGAQATYSPTAAADLSLEHYNAFKDGTEPTAGYVFANEQQTPMTNIYELASTSSKANLCTKDLGGVFVPDGTVQVSNHVFQGNARCADIPVVVNKGRLRLGFGVKAGTGKSWITYDNATLHYLGPDTAAIPTPEQQLTIRETTYRQGDKGHICIAFDGTEDVAMDHNVARRITITDKDGNIVARGVSGTNCYDNAWHLTSIRLTLSQKLADSDYTVNIPANTLLTKELAYDVYTLPISATFRGTITQADDGDNDDPIEELSENQTYADGVRIAWQYNRQKYVGEGSYGRAIRLEDGRYALVYSTGGSNIGGINYIRWQNTPYGSWSAATIQKRNNAYCTHKNAEIFRLKDGRLMYAWLYRTNFNNSKGPSKIMASYSTDGGRTWKNEQVIYTATDMGQYGVWEPAMVQLPSGELQIYFANEASASGNTQNISMRRSFNGGRTWLPGTEVVAYRSGSRDGMPVPVYLKNKKGIAVAIEDPGFMGTFKPMVVHTDAADNWKSGVVDGSSAHRWSIFANSADYLPSAVYCGQPYLLQLPTGETVYSAASGEDRDPNTSDNHGRMAVYVGNSSAKNFIARSFPFPFTNDPNARAIWNSIMQYNDSTLMAVCTVEGEISKVGIWTSEGKIMRPIASEHTEGERDWNALPGELFIGAESQAEARIRSLWDEDSLYLRFQVKDKYMTKGAVSDASDGVEFFVSTIKPRTTSSKAKQYRFLADVEGRVLMQHGTTSGWVTDAATTARSQVTRGTGNYVIELAIPWTAIEGRPTTGDLYCCYQLHNFDTAGGKTTFVHETLSGSKTENFTTWMRMPTTASTAIGQTAAGNVLTTDKTYDLSGRMVSPQSHGVVITGGRKVLR
ncbi:MAG: hypothetical protein HUK03_06085 [Bacteroidaceae bacterium]|nr:hypothetical protein [Bacteroidaceae bacterium]